MFAALLTLLPALRVPTIFAVQSAGAEKFAIDACVQAVQVYFPCESQAPASNHTCLCEQYLWRLSCFDEHASSTRSNIDRQSTEADATRHCRAAGSFGANIIQRRQRLHRRQIGSVISSIAGDVTSILASNDVTIPTAIVTSAINGVIQTLDPSAAPTADVTAIASSIEAAASSAPSSRSLSATQTSTSATAAASPTSSSSGSSGPPIGTIVGAVVGGVGALALLGILIMLILRHKKKAAAHTPTDKEASPASSYSEPHRSPTLINASPHLSDATTSSYPGSTSGAGTGVGATATAHTPSTFTPHTQHQYPQNQHHYPHTEEKIAFHMQPQHPKENEMATSANAWEIDGREMQSPQELESPSVAAAHVRPFQPSPWERRVVSGEGEGVVEGGGARQDEYFGSPVSPVSPIESRRF